jgi:hypothetical protein
LDFRTISATALDARLIGRNGIGVTPRPRCALRITTRAPNPLTTVPEAVRYTSWIAFGEFHFFWKYPDRRVVPPAHGNRLVTRTLFPELSRCRPNVCSRSISTELRCPRDVRFPSVSDRITKIAGGPLRATFGLMHRSKQLKLFDRFVGASEQEMRHCELAELARVTGVNSPKEICAHERQRSPNALIRPMMFVKADEVGLNGSRIHNSKAETVRWRTEHYD